MFPRSTSKGGGIVIFYKSILHGRLHFIENILDSIIWVKFDKSCQNENDIYFAFCYIPPEGSVFYERHDVDIFYCMEESIARYKTIGSVYVAGDLNSRTSDRLDYIENDTLHTDLFNVIAPVVEYNIEPECSKRKSMDIGINTFGRKLINLCKSSSLRIVNGRHSMDLSGNITFYNATGKSLIDYLLAEPSRLDSVKTFSSGNFNTFSDHSPITFSISYVCPIVGQQIENVDDASTDGRTACRTVRWNDENTNDILDKLHENIGSIHEVLNTNFDCQNDVNTCVDSINDILNDCVLPLCDISMSKPYSQNKSKTKTNKPWFNDTCTNLFKEYKNALYNFNKCKSDQNHELLVAAKHTYKKVENKLKRKYKRQEGDMLNYLKNSNPKQFYKLFSKKKSRITNNLTNNDFMTHFKNLMFDENGDTDFNFNEVNNESVFEELDCEITEDEILKAISNLKSNKSCSEDGIINEIFIKGKTILLPCLHKLFNSLFISGYFPEIWTKACIVPIFKKGDANNANNYRGISLVSCFGKLFTGVLNNRILKWEKEYNVLTDAQFGFRNGLSTVDAIFVLQTLINKTLSKKKRLYCCFVDFQKAFDFVDRCKLWQKLVHVGIRGKFLKIVTSLYENIRSCVKYQGVLSEYFPSNFGLMQGEVLSPILFSLYVNDFEINFIKDNCPSLELQMINIFLLMYADDMVLLAETPEGLQSMLHSLERYTNYWNLKVNVDKTKVVIFRNGGKIKENEIWFYDNKQLDVVNEFKYLGLLFNYNGKFLKTQRHIAEQGRKAAFAISATFKIIVLM